MDNRKESSDGEDIPSDFFDDFSKDEFIEGLSVIDSWDDDDKKPSGSRMRAKLERVDRDMDLRQLIERESHQDKSAYENRFKWKRNTQDIGYQKRSSDRKQEESTSHIDDYIKPGSRRDPSKTNEAIKKDKEVKVKEYLAKHLESGDDLRPPGTELDDYFEEQKSTEEKKRKTAERKLSSHSPLKKHRLSPIKYRRESPIRNHHHHHRESPPPHKYHRKPWSPRGPPFIPRRSPYRGHRNHGSYKPYRNYHHDSPRRRSPEILIRRERRSRSPYRRSHRRSRSRSPDWRHERKVNRRSHSRSSNHMPGADDFLYPKSYTFPTSTEYSSIPEMPYQVSPAPQYAEPAPVEYPYSEPQAPGYSYAPGPAYSGYGVSYAYEQPTMVMSVPQPVPAPVMATADSAMVNPLQQPTMVPPPQQATSILNTASDSVQNAPADALAKLVADGKLSHEDYLKLAPNKGGPQVMDTQARVAVLNRCHNAMSRLGYLSLPNRLLINNVFIGNEQKQIVSKFCSPLKRQAVSDFYFTKFKPSAIAQHNKQIVDSVIAALDIEKFVGKTKNQPQKDTKEVAVQTTRPFCEMCEIRESTKFSDVGTSIDPVHFSSSVHTQVVEQDLYSSRSVFNPTGGGMAEGANMSIAHMTPAQLVSQLAARAKTLKQAEPPSSHYRHDNRYDYDGRGDQYRNYNNYRY